jgi:hypothetical protein
VCGELWVHYQVHFYKPKININFNLAPCSEIRRQLISTWTNMFGEVDQTLPNRPADIPFKFVDTAGVVDYSWMRLPRPCSYWETCSVFTSYVINLTWTNATYDDKQSPSVSAFVSCTGDAKVNNYSAAPSCLTAMMVIIAYAPFPTPAGDDPDYMWIQLSNASMNPSPCNVRGLISIVKGVARI